MTEKLTRKQLKTLKDSLGKQGLTLEDHEKAQNSEGTFEILQIDSFEVKKPSDPEKDADGWVVGYGVEYNGVGISAAVETSSDDEPLPENPEAAEESSGFSSDPPSDLDEPPPPHRRSSDEISDQGQLLYGIDDQLFVNRKYVVPVKTVLTTLAGEQKHFETGDFVTTKRFQLPENAQNSDEDVHNDYQPIGQDPCDQESSEEEESAAESARYPLDPNTSSGLWNDYIISVPGFKMESQEEKARSDAIKLDDEKSAQISSIASGFQLPTPPGWENVTDEKLLDFIKLKI